jgi:hypothetical protein
MSYFYILFSSLVSHTHMFICLLLNSFILKVVFVNVIFRRMIPFDLIEISFIF